ncbi:flavonoid 4'-O-methyltransferase-like [Neltuma alba]|uniref:flavonoid 4'-O-methyltransferase-like n=1 Tax=Neltuma alba TaxID=207710 RepID=UPI0010A38DF9|nr:flavonoid 4'-O-methyltransferase-like [Prosopis alba]
MDGTGDKTADLFHGQAQLYRLMHLWMSSLCLKCAIELEIPDIIHKHGQPISLSQLVSDLKVPPSKTTFIKGLMRLLAHNGLFTIIKSNNNEEEESEVSYDLTSASQLLVNDLGSVFDGLNSIVDVGGGTGTAAMIICEAFPKFKCTVLDLPEVVSNLSGNCNMSFVSGDMLKSIPHADAVLIKWVLHDWGDDDCLKILKNAKEAISGNGKGGKVIIIDTVLNEKQEQHEVLETKLLLNIMLAAEFNSKERSEEEWKKLFLKAGFTDYQIFPVFGFRSLIVLHP